MKGGRKERIHGRGREECLKEALKNHKFVVSLTRGSWDRRALSQFLFLKWFQSVNCNIWKRRVSIQHRSLRLSEEEKKQNVRNSRRVLICGTKGRTRSHSPSLSRLPSSTLVNVFHDEDSKLLRLKID
jgi:hypothetical protein